MTQITKENFEQNMEGYMRIHYAVEQLADKYVSTFGDSGHEYVSNFEIEYDGILGSIQIETEASYCGCCGPDYSSYNIPLSALFDDKWIENEKSRRAEEQRKKDEEKAAKKAKRKKEIEAERYQKFLKMKEEYES